MEARVQSIKKERGVDSHDFNKLKKLICFQQKYQESTKLAEYPLHQLICLGLLEIHIALSNPSINVGTPDCELDMEQDEMRKALLIKQETEWLDFDFVPFC